jgi:hypothetical protein
VLEAVQSPVTEDGMLEIAGKSEKIDAKENSTIAGWIRERDDADDHDDNRKDDEYPGIVLNEYGKGRSVFHAFDLEETLNESSYSQLLELLRNSLEYVHRTDIGEEIRPYQFVGHRVDLENLADVPLDVKVDLTYSEELNLFSPHFGGWIPDNPWSIELTVPGLDKTSILYYIYTPDSVGSYHIAIDVWLKDDMDFILYDSLQKEVLIENTISGMIDDVFLLVSQIADTKDRRHLEKHLEKIRNLDIESESDLEKAIHECLMALEYAGEGDYTDIRHELINLLRSLEGVWYFSAK